MSMKVSLVAALCACLACNILLWKFISPGLPREKKYKVPICHFSNRPLCSRRCFSWCCRCNGVSFNLPLGDVLMLRFGSRKYADTLK